MEFCEAMGQWFRNYEAAITSSQQKSLRNKGKSQACPRLHLDRTSPHWLLHRLDCAPPPPEAQSWLSRVNIDQSEIMRRAGQTLLMVTDTSGLPLGFDIVSVGVANPKGGAFVKGTNQKIKDNGESKMTERILGLLRHCMEAPMSGGAPRRPQTLRVLDRKLHKLLRRSVDAVSALRLTLTSHAVDDWGAAELDSETGGQGGVPFALRWPVMRHCHVCKRYSFCCQLKPCPQCNAVLYCSERCSEIDQSRCPEDSSHQHWCKKLAQYLRHGAELADLPFSYAAEVTGEDFEIERFLTQNRLDHGYWVHWSLLVRSPHFLLHSDMDHSGENTPSWFTGHADPYGPLKAESDILLSCSGKGPRAPSLTSPLVSWVQYCKWRGLSLSSPVVALLSSPLSIYYIMTSLVPRDFPELNILKKKSLKIHIIESNREFQSLMVFWELAMLLPHVTFELLFIGEGLPQECDEQQFLLQQKGDRLILVCPSFAHEDGVGKRSIRVKGYRRAYHMLQGPKPDLVIGFRPAFRLHDFWLSTLPRLQSLKVPAYFCEDNELSCVCSQQVMGVATGGALSPPHINPFHSPLRITRGDNKLPWYSNAFVFRLIYKTVATCPQRVPVARPRPCDPAQPLPPANQKAGVRQNPPPEASKMTRKERKQAARNVPRKRK
ncbi:hypothetical protein SKAU_G00367720 [Synaphobranchus kaupii]|uniref:MYND-type domain-containing protein n=1 Tax=Synaphobranchus kaupii TaxID=118154 RepID=A0A9Q1EFG3_SYNKA|nr:hypothetical protein SKAU_G00367720 [Synaphobranchus kaupii]